MPWVTNRPHTGFSRSQSRWKMKTQTDMSGYARTKRFPSQDSTKSPRYPISGLRDAMTKVSTHHHDDLPEKDIRLCTTKPASATNVPPSSYAFFVNVPNSPLGPGPGFSLRVNCQMGFPPDRDSSSKIKISKVLEEAKMWLCPHVKLNDSWVVDAIYGLFYPRERFDDPIEQYRAE